MVKPIMSKKIEPIPKQYQKQAEALIHEIGQLADKLWAFVSELGDNVEIEGSNCITKIMTKPQEAR